MTDSRAGRRWPCLVVTGPGLEALAAAELETLGIAGRAIEGGVAFEGGFPELATANRWLRTASRVLVRIARFRATSFAELERHAKRIEWGAWLGDDAAASFRVTCHKSRLYHSDAVAERLQRAVGPRGAGGGDQLFVVRFFRDECTVSADSSGDHLHFRGWRTATARAPLRETIAAAMLLASRWTGAAPLVDPMCGSGTIPIEGARFAQGLPPAVRRAYAFQRWPLFRGWREPGPGTAATPGPSAAAAIVGADRDAGAIAAASENASRAGVAGDVRWLRQPLSAIEPVGERGWIVTNPPYGKRVRGGSDLRDLYARFGQLVRARFEGWRVVVLSADVSLDRATGLRWEERFRTTNGGIPVRCLEWSG